jgi:hypothetical protein
LIFLGTESLQQIRRKRLEFFINKNNSCQYAGLCVMSQIKVARQTATAFMYA